MYAPVRMEFPITAGLLNRDPCFFGGIILRVSGNSSRMGVYIGLRSILKTQYLEKEGRDMGLTNYVPRFMEHHAVDRYQCHVARFAYHRLG